MGEFINKKKMGELFMENFKIMIFKDVNGVFVFYLVIKIDVIVEKEYFKVLEYRFNYDDLIGLLRC